MSRHHARHRQSTQPLQIVKRAATAAGFGVVTAAAVVGTSAAAWACPTGSHTNTGASVHRAVVHGHASSGEHEHATKHVAAHSTSKGSGHTTTGSGHTTDTTGSTPGGTASAGATRGASPSNPDGMSNGGVDKPWGGAAANDDADGNNGSGNDADCEDDNNGVGTPGHCRTTVHHHGHTPTQGERGTHRHGAGCEHTAGQGTTGGTESGQSGSGQSGSGQSGSGQSGSGQSGSGQSGSGQSGSGQTGSQSGAGQSGQTVATGSAGAQTASNGGTVAVTGAGGTSSAAGATAPQVLGEQVSRSTTTAATSAGTSTVAGTTATAGATTGATTGAAATSPSSTQLPFTGSDDLPIVALLGAAGIVTGAGLVRAARRRKPQTREAGI